MNTEDNAILKMVRSGIEELLAALSDNRRDAARQTFTQVRAVLDGRPIGLLLDTLLTGDVPVCKVADHLYCAGLCDFDLMRRAHAIVQDVQPGHTPLMLVRIDALAGGARHMSDLDGIGIMTLPPVNVDLETLVHEFVHGFFSSGHRMLDEGLAEWLGVLAVSAGPQDAREKLAVRSEQGPPLSVLAARRWTEQPCFEGLEIPAGSAHAVAALAVADYAERHGMPALLDLMRRVGGERIEDIRSLIGVPPIAPSGDIDIADRESLRRQFRIGDVSGAADRLMAARSRHLEHPDDERLEEDYLILLLLSADEPDAISLREEFDTALERYVSRQDDAPFAFALCVSREGLNIRYAPDFIALNESFQRGRAIIEAALDMFESDIDVVTTAAKFELFTPLEYGGNPARASSYLQRARTLTKDPALAAHLDRAIAGLSLKKDAA